MKKLTTQSIVSGLFLALSLPVTVFAGEGEVRKALEAKVGKAEKLTKSPVSGIWEAIVDSQVFYVDDAGKYIFVGNLIEAKSGRNLTSERQFAMLPLHLALKQVRGDGKNILVTFEDPNCGYCKKLGKDIQKLKNATVYTFLYPVLGEDSMEKSKAIWCSADKSKAWVELMTAGKSVTPAAENCDISGLEASVELGRKMRISGTPAMFFGNGDRVGGYIPAEEIEKRFGKPGV